MPPVLSDPATPETPKTITVERRADDLMAFVDGDEKIWGCGPTAAAAVYDLLLHHPDRCGIRIVRKQD